MYNSKIKTEEGNNNKYDNFDDEGDYDYNYKKEDNNTRMEKPQRNNGSINSKYNYKNRKNIDYNQNEDFNSNKNLDNNNNSFGNYNINKENEKEMKTLPKKENEYITIITERNKIIGCERDKMQTLINNREYQTVEKELSILIKEKDKLEGSLLKMPEHPRKLNDIRNKKEINDLIERIESDVGHVRSMLKRTNDYYIKKI